MNARALTCLFCGLGFAVLEVIAWKLVAIHDDLQQLIGVIASHR